MGKDKKDTKKDRMKKSQKKDKKSKKDKRGKKDKRDKKDKKDRKENEDKVGGRDVKLTISIDDYFLRSDHFRVWLKLVKHIAFDTLQTEEARSFFEGTNLYASILNVEHIENLT